MLILAARIGATVTGTATTGKNPGSWSQKSPELVSGLFSTRQTRGLLRD
jgi:hypothetical protein